MQCCNCWDNIEQDRLEILPDTKVCAHCARKFVRLKPLKGIMVWGHKTAGEIQPIAQTGMGQAQEYH